MARTVLAASLFLSSLASAAPPKLVTVKHSSGAQISMPKGWQGVIDTNMAQYESQELQASLEVSTQAATESLGVGDFLEQMVQGKVKKAQKGWYCVEGTTGVDAKAGACGKEDTKKGILTFVQLSAPPATYRSLGGLKLVLKVAQTAKMFGLEATAVEGEGGNPGDGGLEGTMGVPECDGVFHKLARCVQTSKTLDAETKKQTLEALKSSWEQMKASSTTESRDALQSACKQMDDAFADYVKSMDCTY